MLFVVMNSHDALVTMCGLAPAARLAIIPMADAPWVITTPLDQF